MRSVIRPIVERLPFMLYPFFGVYALGTLGIVQVLAGSIVAMAVAGLDTAKKVAYEEDLKRRQQEIMTLAEPLNDHVIHDKEMGNARADVLRKYLLSNEHAVSVFARCKLDRDEISELLTMLERHDSPDISVPEFLGACSRLHGDVHSKDVYTVILALERATKQEDRLGLMFSDTFRHLLFVSIVSQRIGKVIRLRREAEGFQRFGSVQPKLVAAEPKFRMPPFFVKTYHPRANSIPVKGLFE